MNNIIYFDFNNDNQINIVGVVTHVPRRGWRHKFGKAKMVIANDTR
jgi:hypothetical protein